MKRRGDYCETFDDGPGGWLGWEGGGGGPRRLEILQSAAVVRSPWGVDFNHAPPGAGYLHLLYVLLTFPKKAMEALAGRNRFVGGGFSRDLRGADFVVRLKGDLDAKGARLLLLVQADVGPVRANHVLLAQPIPVGPTWRETRLHLAPDPTQWLCLGTRGQGADCASYGFAPIERVLADVNIDLILVLFPLDVRPAVAVSGDAHRLRAGRDWPVDASRLPRGEVWLDEVRIEYPS